MSPTSDEPFARPLTAEEMEQIRRATKDEKRLLSDDLGAAAPGRPEAAFRRGRACRILLALTPAPTVA